MLWVARKRILIWPVIFLMFPQISLSLGSVNNKLFISLPLLTYQRLFTKVKVYSIRWYEDYINFYEPVVCLYVRVAITSTSYLLQDHSLHFLGVKPHLNITWFVFSPSVFFNDKVAERLSLLEALDLMPKKDIIVKPFRASFLCDPLGSSDLTIEFSFPRLVRPCIKYFFII